ncbi:uncharacterized protein LOC128334053 isoform X2 [Hemicordylus capensis]|uniref:uncharacterized protein LOC128334053 isoform X2 n=1 Tax=Hemicordylus capensis TaxID=884348 RepID=UPI0023042AAC|nr:uncharacterized protein LOC128334053 isoform X2 [Hemicordylus capensis]
MWQMLGWAEGLLQRAVGAAPPASFLACLLGASLPAYSSSGFTGAYTEASLQAPPTRRSAERRPGGKQLLAAGLLPRLPARRTSSREEGKQGCETNFMKSWNTNMLVAYDCSSIMHYGRNAFSMTGLPTTVPLSSSYIILGQRWNLSNSDIARVNKFYKCFQAAAQPETSDGRPENVTGFVPSSMEPESKDYIPTAWSSVPSATEEARSASETVQELQELAQVGSTLPPNRSVEEASSVAEAPMRTLAPGMERRNPSTVSPGAPSKAYLMMSEGLPHNTRLLEMETKMTASTAAQKSSEPQALQNPTRGSGVLRIQSPSYTQSGQSPIEGTRANQGIALAAYTRTKSTVPPFSLGKGAARRLDRLVQSTLLSGSRAMDVGQITELPSPMETGIDESENGSPSSIKGGPFTVVENQTKEGMDLFHPATSHSRSKTGHLQDMHSVEGIQDKAVSSSYMTPSRRAPGSTVVPNAGASSNPPDSEARSQALFTISSHRGIVGKEEKGFYNKEPAFTLASHSRKPSVAQEREYGMLPTDGDRGLGSSRAQSQHLDRLRAPTGEPSPWATTAGDSADSRQKEPFSESSPMGSTSIEMGTIFPLPLTHQTRKGYRQGVLAHTPLGPVSETEQVMHETWPLLRSHETPRSAAAETVVGIPPVQLELQTERGHLEGTAWPMSKTGGGANAELPSQAPVQEEQALLATEMEQAMHSTEETSPLKLSWSPSSRPAQRRHTASSLQPRNMEGYSSSAHAAGWTARVHAEESLKHATEAATMESLSRGQKASVGHEEEPGGKRPAGTELPKEAKTHKRASLWQVLPTASLGSQILRNPECGMAETRQQEQPPPPHSVGTSIAGTGDGGHGQAKNSTGLRTVPSQSQCRGRVAGSSYMKPATKRPASLDIPLENEATQESKSGAETKGHSSVSKGRSLPKESEKVLSVPETSTSPSWRRDTKNRREENGMGHYPQPLEETSLAVMSELTKPHKRTPESTIASDQGTAKTTSAGSSHFSTTLAFGNPTLQGVQEPRRSLRLGGTGSESVPNDGGPPVKYLESATERKGSSREITSPFAEGRPSEPANATEKSYHGIKWATTQGWKDALEKSRDTTSPLSEAQPMALIHGINEGTAVPLTAPESPTLLNYRKGPAGRHSTKETLQSRQASETQTVVNGGEITVSSMMEGKPEQDGGPSVVNPNFLHYIDKRSLPEIMARTLVLALPQEEDCNCEPLGLNCRCLNPSKPTVAGSVKTKAFLKKHVLRTMMAAAAALGNGHKPEKAVGMSASNIELPHLCRKLPSAVEMAGNDLPAPRRTMKAAQPLFCSFEQDLCGWEQSKEDDLDWILEKEQEQSVDDQDIAGMPCRASGGYISLKSPTIQVPSKKAILISPVLHGTRCLKFWYRTMGSVAGKINIYTKLLISSEWYKVWSMKEDQGMDWYPVAIPISEIGELQMALEGVTGHNLGSRAGIDDLLVCRKPCWECYNTKSILCGENKIN